MNFKIFTRGTYFYIIDENEKEYEGLKKDVRVRRLTSNSSEFYFDNINGWNDQKSGVDIANILKEDGSPYSLAEFIEFKESETGNFNLGGGSPQEPINITEFVRKSELPNLYITERNNSYNLKNIWWGKRPTTSINTSDAVPGVNFGNDFNAISNINGNQSVFYNLENKSLYINKLVNSITHGVDGVLRLGIITFKKVNNLGFATVPDDIARYEFVLGTMEFQKSYNFVLDNLNIEIPIQHQVVCFFYIENEDSTRQVFNSVIHFIISANGV